MVQILVFELLIHNPTTFTFSLGPTNMPESLVRVQKLTGKTLTFYEADLCNKESLRNVVSKVKDIFSPELKKKEKK